MAGERAHHNANLRGTKSSRKRWRNGGFNVADLDDGSGARARVCEGGGGGCGLGVKGSEAAPYIGAGPGLGVWAKEGRERRVWCQDSGSNPSSL